MPTPVAHLLTGVAIHQATDRRRPRLEPSRLFGMAWIAAWAMAPDLDLLVSWLLTGNRLIHHRHWTHSITAVLLAAAIGGALLHGRWGWVRSVCLTGGAVASHVFLDILTGPSFGLHPSYGVPLLAPFLPQRQDLPLSLLPGVGPGIWTLRNAGIVMLELALFAPLAAGAALLPRREAAP